MSLPGLLPLLIPLEGAPEFGEHSFDSTHLFPNTPGLTWLTNHHVQAMVGALLAILLWLWLSRNLKVVPGKRQALGERLYDLVRNGIARDIFGPDFGKTKNIMVPYLIALFTFIVINNLFGEFLFMFPTNSKIGFPYGLALLTYLLYIGMGIREHGAGAYFKKSLIPPGVPTWLLPLIIPLEFISNFVTRPITLALRLFANMFAGHLVVLVFVVGGGWLLTQFPHNPLYGSAGIVSLLFSFAIFALELLVACLQAYIFTVLTAQYVSSSVAHEH